MQIGMIGMGRMGGDMIRCLLKGGHECVIHDANAEAMSALRKQGASESSSLEDFVSRLKKPRTVVGPDAQRGYLHCGPHGAGHFVKMVHNGIEYEIMAAYAEGLNALRNANASMRAIVSDAETTPLRCRPWLGTAAAARLSRPASGMAVYPGRRRKGRHARHFGQDRYGIDPYRDRPPIEP